MNAFEKGGELFQAKTFVGYFCCDQIGEEETFLFAKYFSDQFVYYTKIVWQLINASSK